MARRSEVEELQERLQAAVSFTQTGRIDLLSSLCREKEEDLLHLEERIAQLSDVVGTQQAVNARLNYHLSVLLQDRPDVKQQLIARFTREVKEMSASRNSDLEAMSDEYEEIRGRQEQITCKRQALEVTLRNERMNFAGLADHNTTLRREGDALTQVLAKTEEKLHSFQEQAATQTCQLRQLQEQLQEEREIQQAANYHQSRTRSSSPGAAMQSPHATYFPSILRSFRSVTNLRD
jgi:chromosome segregation ATPase